MRSVVRGLSVGAVVLLAAIGCDHSDPTQSTTAAPTANPPRLRSVVVAVDGMGVGDGGLNPHLLADLSQTTTAIASLTLPSPFRPVSDPTVAGGVAWHQDHSLVSAVDVLSNTPLTVRYRLRPEAQWADGAPIVAEDFQYLWQQMISQPGTVDAAGYGLIDHINSGRGGKEVVVVFRDTYPLWQQLFSNLLPAHVGRSNNGGFSRAFENGFLIAGGRFRVDHIDRNREEALLVRNDRYWDTPAWADQITLRRFGSGTQIASALRNSETHLALVHGSASVLSQLQVVPQVRAEVEPGQASMSITVNARDAQLADQGTREALLGVLDQGLLARIGAQDALALPAMGVNPPVQITTDQARTQLLAQGYTQIATPPRSGAVPLLHKEGHTLSLVIGVAENDARAIAVAYTAADQWRSVGVDASVAQLPPRDLYDSALRNNRVQAIVGWSSAGSDLATTLFSRYACAQPVQDTDHAVPTVTVDPVGTQGVRNLSGICLPDLQHDLAEALSGRLSAVTVQTEVMNRLQGIAVELPLMRDAGLLAAGPGIHGVVFGAPALIGPMAAAASWELVE